MATDNKLKFIWMAINKIAPLMRMEPFEYKYKIVYETIGSMSGSIRGLSHIGYTELRKRLLSDAQAVGISLIKKEEPLNLSHFEKLRENEKKAENDKMRKKIISMMRECGYEKFSHQRGGMVADMPRIYALVENKGYLKKPLNEYSHNELPKLVSQMESIYISIIKSNKK